MIKDLINSRGIPQGKITKPLIEIERGSLDFLPKLGESRQKRQENKSQSNSKSQIKTFQDLESYCKIKDDCKENDSNNNGNKQQRNIKHIKKDDDLSMSFI